MGERELQEQFRQLALDLDAVKDDDPKLRSFELSRDGHRVRFDFRAYKARLELTVESSTSKHRPQITFVGIGLVDRLGRTLGTEGRGPVDDPSFLAKIDWTTDAPAELVGQVLAPDEGRRALEALAAADALPVWISNESVGIHHEGVSARDLDAKRIRELVDALCTLERSLGQASVEKDRSPLVAPDGRRLIRPEPRTSPFATVLDYAPVAAFVLLVPSLLIWNALPGEAVDRAWGVFAAIGVVFAVGSEAALLSSLRGQKGALARSLWRALGVTLIGSYASFFALHAFNRSADPTPPHVEDVTVLSITRPTSKNDGAADYRRPGSDQVYRLGTAWGVTEGKPLPLRFHDGRLGWEWVEVVKKR